MTWQTKITEEYDSLKSICYLLNFFNASHPKKHDQTVKFLHLEIQIEILTPRTACWRPLWVMKSIKSKILGESMIELPELLEAFCSEWSSTQFKTRHEKKNICIYIYMYVYIYIHVNICLYTYNLIAIFWSTNQWPGKSQSSSLQY